MLKVKMPRDTEMKGTIISATYNKEGYFLFKYNIDNYGVLNHKIKALQYYNYHSDYSLDDFYKYINRFSISSEIEKYEYLTSDNYKYIINSLNKFVGLKVKITLISSSSKKPKIKVVEDKSV